MENPKNFQSYLRIKNPIWLTSYNLVYLNHQHNRISMLFEKNLLQCTVNLLAKRKKKKYRISTFSPPCYFVWEMRSIVSWTAEERKITSKSRIYWANLRRKVALFTTWWWWCTRSWCTPLAHVATLECWNAHWSIWYLWGVVKTLLMWVPMAPNNISLWV